MSNPCTTCQPMPSCTEGLDRYSLQSDNYLFVLNCPPGYGCDHVGTVGLICCDGTEYSVTLEADMLASERAAILQDMLDQCGRRLAFCQDPGPNPSGGGGGGDGLDPDPNPTPNPPVPPPAPPSTPEQPGTDLYYSNPVSITLVCPGGAGTFMFTLPAGRVIAFTQAEADAKAFVIANQLAIARRLCLSVLPVQGCAESAVTANVAVSGPGNVFHWSVVAGAVPTGMTLAEGWRNGHFTTLSGTPTTPGTYTFTIRVRSVNGDFTDRSYTLCIVGMTPATLPNGDIGTAYSQTLTAPACATTPLSWQITAGALPDGLFLDEQTGVISGIPTVDGTFNFTVTLQTEAT